METRSRLRPISSPALLAAPQKTKARYVDNYVVDAKVVDGLLLFVSFVSQEGMEGYLR